MKYLTSSKLLHLQLRDPAFRKHFLLQCLILAHYCQRPPKADNAAKGELLEKVKAMEDSLWAALESMDSSGPKFAATLRTVIQVNI